MASGAVLKQTLHFEAPALTNASPRSHVIEENRSSQSGIDLTLGGQFLTASPYEGIEHLLDLRSVDIQNRLLAEALLTLAPAVDEYATAPYELSLNWDSVFRRLRQLVDASGHRWSAMEFYVVEFRSKLQSDIDRPLLFKLDKESHREATQSGGLLKYWFGTPNSERRNLATCLWRNKQDAIKGGSGPWHRQARKIIPRMYESINVKGLKLAIDDDVRSWTFGPFA